MDSHAFIGTKEAAKITGYSPDYVARLLRAGDIRGVREGKAWRIDRASLDAYLERKQRRGVRRAMELSHERRETYQASSGIPRFFTPPAAAIALREPVPVFSRATALAIAAILVTSSSLLAASPAIPQAFSDIEPIARQVAAEADMLKERAGNYVEARLALIRGEAAVSRARVLDAPLAYAPSPETARTVAALATLTSATASMPEPRSIAYVPIESGARAFVEAVRSLRDAVQNPSVIPHAAQEAFRALAVRTGAYGLALGATLRDALVLAPGALLEFHAAFGRLIVAATHAAIAAEVGFSYAAADATTSGIRTFVATTADITSMYAAFLVNAGRLAYEGAGFTRGASFTAVAAFSSAYLAAVGAGTTGSFQE